MLIHHSHVHHLLGIAERVSFFVYSVVLRVHIHWGDYEIEGANVLESTRTKTKRALIDRSQQRTVLHAVMIMLDI